ncbi:MAG: glucose 1-dehydrogenase [Bryobacterales bacterium]|nr:glucose 1-dehydrogenase [Bryobacteraceae bacterium]MDW8354604.1 glucose 1-dehydrogenase [Bryobacterales bacterium]
MSREFEGKTAVVTGASRGIGAATAVALARRGASRLLLHYNSYRQGAERTLAAVRAAGSEGELLPADLSTREGIHALAEALRERDADILVNNAGSLVRRAGLLEFTEELFDTVMDLNFRSAWFVAQAVVPGMLRKGSGVIVNVSSIAARNGGGPGATVYAAAKAALSAMTKGLARELAPKGIRVNAVSPGTVDNDFHRRFSTREVLEQVVHMTPAGRLSTNEDVADVIVFLCSDAARYIHGQTIEVNGGLLAP